MMIQYTLQKNLLTNKYCSAQFIDNPMTSIPFDQANTDYAQFKKDILEGAELLDADGQLIDAIQFVKDLP
jgi:hypothetical protein